jgi:hypothetical protein
MHNVLLIIIEEVYPCASSKTAIFTTSPLQAAPADGKKSGVVADSDQDNVSGKCWQHTATLAH